MPKPSGCKPSTKEGDAHFKVRSHVLTLREGELDSRLKDRERTIDLLSLQLRELNVTLRKERATRESLTRRLATLGNELLA